MRTFYALHGHRISAKVGTVTDKVGTVTDPSRNLMDRGQVVVEVDADEVWSPMPRGGGNYRALTNEKSYPYIVELPASERRGLGVALNREIIQFHKIRHVQPRHSDLATADSFAEQFDGTLLHKRNRWRKDEARRIAANIAKLPERIEKKIVPKSVGQFH